MATPWRKPVDSLDRQKSESSLPQWVVNANAVLISAGRQMRRGGWRVLLLIGGFVAAVLLLSHMMSSRLEAGYQSVLAWSSPSPVDTSDMRIVVFGSQDVIGSAADTGNTRYTWTEHLCVEFNCTSLVSLVPKKNLSPGLTSNRIYEEELLALQQASEQTNITEKPGADYYFIAEQYPVPAKTPDLEAQIKHFLSLPPPKVPPRQTLWVFTFGTWDIWNLAALPSESGDRLLDSLVVHVFSQIELLYQESLNSPKVARPEAESSATGSPAQMSDECSLEDFRVLIPQAFDITLTPGWQNRPVPPMPHSKAEQMRNAAALTSRWNSQIELKLDEWEQIGKPSASGETQGDGIEQRHHSPRSFRAAHASPSRQDKPTKQDEALDDGYPQRIGVLSDPTEIVLGAMTEGELQRSGLSDSKGRGTLSQNDTMVFPDVWNPCTDAAQAEADCDRPNDHLFDDAFTIGRRATEEVGKLIAQDVIENLCAAA